MAARGKPGKPKAGFPPFPPSLESPQMQRASHIPTAPTTNPYSGKTERPSRAGLTAGPKTVNLRVGQNKLPKWARSSCQTHGYNSVGAGIGVAQRTVPGPGSSRNPSPELHIYRRQSPRNRDGLAGAADNTRVKVALPLDGSDVQPKVRIRRQEPVSYTH